MEERINPEDFTERVDHLRIEKKIRSVRELARSAGIVEGTLANLWKPNRKTLPYADDAVRIAQALNTTVEYLVTGKDFPKDERDPILEEILLMLRDRSHDERVELRGVIRVYIDTHWAEQIPKEREAASQ